MAIGLAISTFCRTRVQAIVAALLTWCAFVFAFDLVALGAIVSFDPPKMVIGPVSGIGFVESGDQLSKSDETKTA